MWPFSFDLTQEAVAELVSAAIVFVALLAGLAICHLPPIAAGWRPVPFLSGDIGRIAALLGDLLLPFRWPPRGRRAAKRSIPECSSQSKAFVSKPRLPVALRAAVNIRIGIVRCPLS
jgi:hypothetical protein